MSPGCCGGTAIVRSRPRPPRDPHRSFSPSARRRPLDEMNDPPTIANGHAHSTPAQNTESVVRPPRRLFGGIRSEVDDLAETYAPPPP